MLAGLILAAGVWLSDPLRYCFQLASETYPSCQFQVGEIQYSDPDAGVSFPITIWQYRGYVWAGNPYCVEGGWIPSEPTALDKGACQPTSMPDAPQAPDLVTV